MELTLPESETVIEQSNGTTTYKLRTKGITTARKAPSEQQVRDLFMTPNYAIDLLIPFIPKNITTIIEPAYGIGKISGKMRSAGYTVLEYDIKDTDPNKVHNFIDGENLLIPENSAIITNPPYSIKDLFIEKCFYYNVPFALIINADYSKWQIDLIKRGCEKIIPTSRVAYITPFILTRVNEMEGTSYTSIDDIPQEYLYKYSNAQFHSMWLTYGFNLGRTETFVELTAKQRKTNI